MKDHQLTLMLKTYKGYNNNNNDKFYMHFDYRSKYYMQNSESVLVSEPRNSLRFYDTDRLPNPGQMIKPSDSQRGKKRKEEEKRETAELWTLPSWQTTE